MASFIPKISRLLIGRWVLYLWVSGAVDISIQPYNRCWELSPCLHEKKWQWTLVWQSTLSHCVWHTHTHTCMQTTKALWKFVCKLLTKTKDVPILGTIFPHLDNIPKWFYTRPQKLLHIHFYCYLQVLPTVVPGHFFFKGYNMVTPSQRFFLFAPSVVYPCLKRITMYHTFTFIHSTCVYWMPALCQASGTDTFQHTY